MLTSQVKQKVERSIGPLLNDQNEVIYSAEGRNQFIKFFSSVFIKELSGEVPETVWMYEENVSGLWAVEITEKIVSEKLYRLRDDKAAEAGDLVPRFINSIYPY